MSLVKQPFHQQEKAVLVSVIHKGQNETQVEEYLDELSFLAETAGAVSLKRFTQKLPAPDGRTYIGAGKLQELKEYVSRRQADLVIFDDDLSGTQINSL